MSFKEQLVIESINDSSFIETLIDAQTMYMLNTCNRGGQCCTTVRCGEWIIFGKLTGCAAVWPFLK